MASSANPPKIDRQTTTPFLLKLFYRQGAFHRLDEFPTSSAPTLPPHLQIYTWQSCTLRELSHLLTTALPSLLPSPSIGTRLSFRLIFPDTRDTRPNVPGRYLAKDLGSVIIGGDLPSARESVDDEDAAGSGAQGQGKVQYEGADAERSLQDARFVIGDYISCAIFPPLANGAVAAGAPPAERGGMYSGGGRSGFGGRGGGGPRENGFGPGRERDRFGDGPGGGYRGRGGRDGGRGGGGFGGGFPSGEWRRGERIPDAPGDRDRGGGYGRGRGRGRGGY